MIIKTNATEKEIKTKVEKFITNLKSTDKNLTGDVITIQKNSTTQDHIHYTVKDYSIMKQSEKTLYTGSNEVLCKIFTENQTNIHHFLPYNSESDEALSIEDISKIVVDIML